jgi:hypothetical protein
VANSRHVVSIIAFAQARPTALGFPRPLPGPFPDRKLDPTCERFFLRQGAGMELVIPFFIALWALVWGSIGA